MTFWGTEVKQNKKTVRNLLALKQRKATNGSRQVRQPHHFSVLSSPSDIPLHVSFLLFRSLQPTRKLIKSVEFTLQNASLESLKSSRQRHGSYIAEQRKEIKRCLGWAECALLLGIVGRMLFPPSKGRERRNSSKFLKTQLYKPNKSCWHLIKYDIK